jgi:hypothetical protein
MLNGDKVRANKREMLGLSECSYNTSMVDTWDEDREKIRQQRGLLLQVERKSLVIAERVRQLISKDRREPSAEHTFQHLLHEQ